MTDLNLRAYRERWRAVEEIEREEQRAASIEQRWQQVNAIFGLASALGLSTRRCDDDAQEDIVRQRWAALRGSA